MADARTNNFNFTIQVTGANSGTWGDDVSNNVFTPLDAILGGTLVVPMSSTDVTLTLAQWQNKAFKITGTLTNLVNLILPLSPNSVGNATAVGGEFIIDNETTGPFNLVVKTAAAGSAGTGVAQGGRQVMYSDTVNVFTANDGAAGKLRSTNGANPNGILGGTAASINTNADVAWDGANLWVCTTTGNAASAVWSSVTGPIHPPQGYLTPTSGTAIIPGDVVGTSTIYYTPYIGNFCPVWTGTQFSQAVFAELPLSLSAGFQNANGIYDVFAFLNSGTMQVAFGPSWGAGSGGNQGFGTCARGTGVGGAALIRKNGIWVNAVSMSAANNGASTFSIPANQGTYLGTVYVDATNGQVSCYRTRGQARKWGVWNAYNRANLILQIADPTGSWSNSSGTLRPSNNNTANNLVALCGLPEEPISTVFNQLANPSVSAEITIGLNSTTSSGSSAVGFLTNASGAGPQVMMTSSLVVPPSLGINQIFSLELVPGGLGLGTFFGSPNMQLSATWRG